MAKKPLRLGFTDYFSGLDQFFLDVLSKQYDITRDDTNPHFLIFCDEVFGQNNLNYNNCVKLFFTGENRRPYNYKTHYAMSFDHHDEFYHYRLPLYMVDYWMMVNNLGMSKLEDVIRTEEDVKSKTKFCGFISGNGGSEKRNQLFQMINSYKQIDSAGPLFNNVPKIPRGLEAAKNKNEFLKDYKFNLCPENSSFPGYVTEKLFHAFYMKTVPIYWGSPTAALDFNPNAFINWHEHNSDEKLLQKVIELDSDDHKYNEIYLSPIFPDNKKPKWWDEDMFHIWFKRIYERHMIA